MVKNQERQEGRRYGQYGVALHVPKVIDDVQSAVITDVLPFGGTAL